MASKIAFFYTRAKPLNSPPYFLAFVKLLEFTKVCQLDPTPQNREQSAARALLKQPNFFLAALAESIQDEIAFYTRDMDGRITYLSKSAEQVLNHNPERLLNRHFSEALTDSPCNEHIRSREWMETNDFSSKGRICEIYDRDGNRVQLKYWQAHIIHEGVPIGLSGIIRRMQDRVIDSDDMTPAEERSLIECVSLLTNVERQVIELVVDGNMNKKMAGILDVAVRTIESRRSRAMIKLRARSLSELVQIWVHVRRIEAKQRAARLSSDPGISPQSSPNASALARL
jgi:PAS domain S-box-containing protein